MENNIVFSEFNLLNSISAVNLPYNFIKNIKFQFHGTVKNFV